MVTPFQKQVQPLENQLTRLRTTRRYSQAYLDTANRIAWLIYQHDPYRAFVLAQDVMEVATALGNRSAYALALRVVAEFYIRRADAIRAADTANRMTLLASELQDPRLEAMGMLEQAQAETRLYNHALGLVYTHHAQERLNQVETWDDDEARETQVRLLNLMAMAHGNLGEFTTALEVLDRALTFFAEGEYDREHARLLNNKANVCFFLGDYAAAVHAAETSVLICEQLRLGGATPVTYVNLLDTLGMVYTRIGRYEEARQFLELGLRENHSPHQHTVIDCYAETDLLLSLGVLEQTQGRPSAAIAAYQQGMAWTERLGMIREQAQFHRHLATLYEESRAFPLALHHLTRHHTLSREIVRQQSDQRIHYYHTVQAAESLKRETRLLQEKNTDLETTITELEHVYWQLHEVTIRDGLTGLHNRRFLEQYLTDRYARGVSTTQPFTIAFVDVDDLKIINDTFLHKVGDDVLRTVGQYLAGMVSDGEVAARIGGEEFVLGLNATLEAAYERCDQLRQSLSAFEWHSFHPELHVTISIGVADATAVSSVEETLRLADQYLYAAKASGKNRVVVT